MKNLITLCALSLLIAISFLPSSSFAQTCTISGSGTIDWSSATCNEGGVTTTTATAIVVPNGVNLDFTTNPSKTASLTIESGGTVTNDKANALWDGNITVNSGGNFVLNQKLDIGSASGCGYSLYLLGHMELNGAGGSDLLSICGNKIAQSGNGSGGGGCTDCGGTFSGTCAYDGSTPYCEPSGGFTGPLGYGENGYNAALPVKVQSLRGRQVNAAIRIDWVTTTEENFSKFVVERSIDGIEYVALGELKGQGRNLQDVKSSYGFMDHSPFLGKNYYRLRQIDIDNTAELSKVLAVDFIGSKSFTVYPNPLNGKTLSYESNFRPSENDRIIVTNQLGVEILNIPATSPRTSLEFKELLESGVYFVKYMGREFQNTVRLIVAK